jgi:L-ascorbate metabolism protein UlaG (beta-lactamase superfamily)
MDPCSEKQVWIDRRREEKVARYPLFWEKLIADWNSPGSDYRAWLMYSANYLFRTQDVRWALDPLSLKCRVPQAPVLEFARDLKELDFVLLTHSHKDHLDFGLLRLLRHLPMRWVVPEAILPLVQREVGLQEKKILVPKPLQAIELNGLRITPFNGLHWEADPGLPGGRRGIPATGYLVEQGIKRWLFPGDTRLFDPACLPDLGPVDVLFAHLWLGRAAAFHPRPPLLEKFCSFYLALQPRRLIITHLQEWGRLAAEFWDRGHADRVVSVLKVHAPFLPVKAAYAGDEIRLD